MTNQKFKGKKVLVTGAASGIGQAQAQAFIQAGAEVIGVDLQEFTADFKTIVCDVSSPEKVAQLAAQVGEIDILLNTAGRLDDYRTMEDTDFSLWKKILATNLDSMFLVTSAFLPQMKKQKSGVIINMASVAGLVAGGGGIAYTASKHAIVGFTKQLALR